MRKKNSFAWLVPLVLVMLAISAGYFFDSDDGAAYTSASTGERGASLLYDTLKKMGFGVRRSYRPLTTEISASDVFVIIQPRSPAVCEFMAAEMLEWVQGGGRLVYLCSRFPNTIIDTSHEVRGRSVGDFMIYRYGSGEIITGRAAPVTNRALMQDHTSGEAIQSTLTRWNAERKIGNIFFAEYYHGAESPTEFAGRMPLAMRLVFLQIIIAVIAAVWHLGKRFGNAVPYYEEVEREENEYVRALARLYMVSKKGDGKNAERTCGQNKKSN